MNKSLTLACTALLLASTAPAFAASSVDLTVKGLITPSACTPNLPGTVDFGKISAKDLNQDSQTQLEAKNLQLTVSCEASTLFAINPVDNRIGTSTRNGAYGLGLINGTEKLGRYFISVRNPVTDIPSIMLTMHAEGRWSELFEDDAVEPNNLFAFGNLDSESGWAPHPLQNAAVEIVLNTAIAPAKDLTLTNEVALDGSATLEVKYL
ncbi:MULTISPECIES: DUF1120 domain-containing protein [Pseudomonas]|uniref:DUF1120 domain-containing protein n=1 Tax=Pseudomonas TaxID=286 RepID=UPI001BFFFA8D|nr:MULTISPECIES: DUF1120 domain-containing protein [Pseudomonas]MBT9299650.1 DUF1120 domain-containing protein [Pseudomonas sp. TAE6080]